MVHSLGVESEVGPCMHEMLDVHSLSKHWRKCLWGRILHVMYIPHAFREQSSVQSVFAFELCAHGLVTRRVGGCMYLLCAYGSCTPELFNCPLGEKLLIESCQKMGAGTVPAMDLYAHLLAQAYSN